MNVKEYISSGVIESYVLGLLTDTERSEFESVCTQHPEVAEARNAFELALEEQLLGDAKEPPRALKQQIEEKLTTTSFDTNADQLEEETTPVRSMGIWKWLAAASIILLAVTAYWAYTTNNKYKDLQAQNKDLRDQLQQSSAQLAEMSQDMNMIQKSGVKMASVKSDPNEARAFATVFWDTTSTTRDVYLMINNLPQPASDKQYQLWAILNGQATDLGKIEVTQHRLLYRMKNVQDAQAFAISIEPKGDNAVVPSQPIGMAKL